MANDAELVVSATPGISVAYAEDLGIEKVSGPDVDVAPNALQNAKSFMDSYTPFLAERAELYGERLQATRFRKRGDVRPQVGEPTVGPYVAMDLLSFSPFEIFGFGNLLFEPHKIIPSGTLCVSWALAWFNPFVDIPNGFAVPANIQLGGLNARLSFHHFNLTTGTATPPVSFNLALPPVVPPFVAFPLFFVAPAVGAVPQLIQQHVTLDIIQPAKPYAAFGTHVVDIDTEPSWLFGFPPAVPAQMEHDIPTTFMVYTQ